MKIALVQTNKRWLLFVPFSEEEEETAKEHVHFRAETYCTMGEIVEGEVRFLEPGTVMDLGGVAIFLNGKQR